MTGAASVVIRALAAGLGAALLSGAAQAADLAGTTWTTDGGSARVTFVEDAQSLVGRIVWLRKQAESGETVLDTKNPDETLRTRPLIGVPLVWGLKPDGKDAWSHGRIYAADDGKTYDAKMKLRGDVLEITGCIKWPLCRDTTWTRAAAE